jgi:hypothetical protein
MPEFTGQSAEPLITLEAILAFAESTKHQREHVKKRQQAERRAQEYLETQRIANAQANTIRKQLVRVNAAAESKKSAKLDAVAESINAQGSFKRIRDCADALLGNFGPIEVFDPHGFCVYLLWGNDEERPIYVGQSINVMGRVGSHMTSDKGPLTRRVQIVRCASREQMCELESALIELYQPPMNIAGR